MNRRLWLRSAGGACGALWMGSTAWAQLLADAGPVVETTSGKVRGSAHAGIHSFKGIPYAASPGGENRFLPPQPVEPWTAVRSCLFYGPACPSSQYGFARDGNNAGRNDEESYLLYRGNSWMPAGEDCLRLNVWTPAVGTSSGKRPVMVYMHGGGFSIGSGNELLAYDGENLSRSGDVVVITHNHRLNVLGYLNLTEFGGEKYAASANVGMLDIVAVLRWVKENAAQFGGDPDNVTIFGQSGGGGKVSALMAMPEAKGLFHRAVVQSGSNLKGRTAEQSARLTAAVLKELGLGISEMDRLPDVPIEALIAAAGAVLAAVPDSVPRDERPSFGPVVDGKVLPRHPFDPDAPEISRDVPMLIGTTRNDGASGLGNPQAWELTEAELLQRGRQRIGEKGEAVIAAYRREYPAANPFEVWTAIASAPRRREAIKQAERKSALGGAAVYQYLFSWYTPVLGGRPGPFHTSEVPFVFDNGGLCVNFTGGGPEALALSKRVSQAWVHFARTGNPQHEGLPAWPAFDARNRATMIFDNQCVLKNGPEREGLDVLGDTEIRGEPRGRRGGTS